MVSDVIRSRLLQAGKRFHANDNIADYIQPKELEELEQELTDKFEQVLQTLIIDTENDPNSKKTAHRIAKMYLHELMRGRYYKAPKITSFPNEKQPATRYSRDSDRPVYSYSGLLVIPAELTSMCSHHHALVRGLCYIGILPGKTIIGLSKYIRLAQWVASRGTLQEQLTEDILRAVQQAAKTKDVAVVVIVTHGCMSCRGVKASHSYVTSAELGGLFFDVHDLRAEFYRHIDMLERQRLA